MPVNTYIPQTARAGAEWRRRAVTAWAVCAAVLLALTALIIVAPLARAAGYNGLAQTLYSGFSPICHQLPDRSFHLHGFPFAVCARCTGLYFGLAAGFTAYPLLRSLRRFDTPARSWLFLALLPVTVDFLLGYTGTWDNTHTSRALTGGLLGAVIALYLVPGVLDLRFHWRNFFSKPAPTEPPSLATVDAEHLIAAAPSDYSAPHRRVKI